MKGTHHPTRRRGRGLGRLFGLLLALVAAIGLTGTTAFALPSHKDTSLIRLPLPQLGAAPKDTVAAMQPSWNLGNTLDAIPDETSWGNPLTTKALFDKIKAEGFRSVRIPVTWSGHQSATAPYTIDAAWMNRVKQVVDWALADGLYVVLNVHHDSWQWISDHAHRPRQRPGPFQGHLDPDRRPRSATPRSHCSSRATTSRSSTTPTDAQGIEYNSEFNTAFHTVVRQSGGNNATRLLMLPTLHTNAGQEFLDALVGEMKSLNDANLVATVHFYGWYPFSVNVAGGTKFDATAQKDMSDTFTRIRDTLTSKGVPVYLGEYGLLNYPDHHHPARVEPGEGLKYFEQFGYEARAAGVTTALWDAFNFLEPQHVPVARPRHHQPDQVELDHPLRNRLLGPGLPGEVERDHRQVAHPEPERR